MTSTTAKPKVSIIIPSRTGEVSRPMGGIEQQTFHDYEIQIVQGVSPVASARNLGVRRTRSDILLFIDDDAILGQDHILRRMVDLLENDPRIAVVGISQQVPPDASRFQRAVASQVPRCSYPIVSDDQVSNPPLDRFGFTAITTLCCAVRRTVFEEVGGFDEDLPSGEDTDFFYRIRRCGYDLVVAANCSVYHSPPTSLRALVRKSFWYGMGHALEAYMSPERRMDILPLNRWYGQLGLVAAILGFPVAFFVHYYFDPVRQIVFGFRPLKTLSTYASLCGYVYGWYHSKPRRAATTGRGAQSGVLKNVEV
jgi:cellulose synthase/poly-beta-1,6-N-acetylglucosamine synthase-like glycosyltransferase